MFDFIFRWTLFAMSFVPAVIHWNWTGPSLWAHNSSSAFDLWVLFCIIAVVCPILGVIILRTKQREPQSHVNEVQPKEKS